LQRYLILGGLRCNGRSFTVEYFILIKVSQNAMYFDCK
jgi:hypothetical protein